MSEPIYIITVTESERSAIAKALGALVTKFIHAPIFDAETRAMLSTSQSPAPPAAASCPAPIEQRDRWAKDRKGNELANPAESFTVDATIWKTQQVDRPGKEKYLRVTWPNGVSGTGYSDANCFDRDLWPWLIKQTGQHNTRLYLVKKGSYMNVVGVRA